MFILLIILVSLLIVGLRLIYFGVDVARKVAVHEIKRRLDKGDLSKKNANLLKNIQGIGTGISKSTIRVLILALQLLRGIFVSLSGLLFIVDVLVFLLAVVSAGGFLTLYDGSGSVMGYSQLQESPDSSINGIDWSIVKDDGARSLLQELSKSWGNEVTKERIDLILFGASKIGSSWYSQQGGWAISGNSSGVPDYGKGQSRGGSLENQVIFDCSSFVGYTYNKQGKTGVHTYETTSSFLTHPLFKEVKSSEAIPGDVVLANRSTLYGNANHAGIYVGKNSEGKMLYMHCTSSAQSSPMKVTNGVRIGFHAWEVYLRLKEWG